MTEATIVSVISETISDNNADAALSNVKQEVALVADAPSAIGGVKQEVIGIYETPTILISNLKQEINFKASVSNRIVGVKQEVLISITQAPPPPPPPPPPTAKPNTFHPLDIPCIPAPRSRFRRFWATQPNVCPAEPGQCDSDPECQQPGLKLLFTTDPTWQQLQCAYDGKGALPADCAPPITGATISTDDYVRGLVINILGTNAAQLPSKCGNRPGQRLGYWLDSISGDQSGSSVRYVPTTGFNTNQSVQFVQMQAQADLKKLIEYGVANQVTVTASYIGNGTIGLKIIVEGVDDQTTIVNATMTKLANAWVWNS